MGVTGGGSKRGRAEALTLVVMRDGIELPVEQARALWRAYREHLERDPGDAAGFAKAHGFASARTETRRSRAVLHLDSLMEAETQQARSSRPTRGPARALPRKTKSDPVRSAAGDPGERGRRGP